MESTAATRRWSVAESQVVVSERRHQVWVAGVAVAAALVRTPLVTKPLGSDEGGLLLLASQWRPGTSLYGGYWVDRPPLLIDVFAFADDLGGVIALRVIGLVLVATSVLLAGRIGRTSGGSPVAPAVTAAVFLSTPLFGAYEINGELIAVPAVLGAIALVLDASRASSRRGTFALGLLAGALAMAAVLVKQNELDGFVFILVGAASFSIQTAPRARLMLLAVCVGAAILGAALLAQASALGTPPMGLWDAVVTFRLDATRVIGSSASGATSDRLRHLLLALTASGAPLLLLVAARRFRARPQAGTPDIRWAASALLSWECVSVLAGGSYWLHYLICLVPGLVLAVSFATARAGDRARDVRFVLTFAAVSALVATTILGAWPGTMRAEPVITWLRTHDSPGQTGIVAYGHPDYLTASGLSSPYPELWSLPVRVRDPDLVNLARVLAGTDRPDWVVTGASGSLSGWGINAARAQPVFSAHYRLVADLGDRRIYLDRSERLNTTREAP